MTKPQSKPKSKRKATTAPRKPRPARRSTLLTEDQVLARLRAEIADESLTTIALRYGIRVQQLSDILYGRANLSKRVTERLRYRLVRLYEKLHVVERESQ